MEPAFVEYTIAPNGDGTSTMTVKDVQFQISPQSLDDEAWAVKLQNKANAFGATLP